MKNIACFMAKELTVTEFNNLVGSVVEFSDCLSSVSVVGEISKLTRSQAGHIYIELKDKDSVISCNLFRNQAMKVNFELKEGMKIVVFGSASYYRKGGKLGFTVESITPYGKGELQKKLEELTAKLLKEGLFDEKRKREIPRYPKTIGVVTSATGAVIKDIIDTTARRFPVDILLAPAIVQGEDAPSSIISGIKLLNSMDVDVIIVGRGGGSKEDLSAFNDEGVVRAICDSKVPVISAVGHATDKSLADMAADKYAETPTAAAMIATPDKQDEKKIVKNLWTRAGRSLEGVIEKMKSRYDRTNAKLSPNGAKLKINTLRERNDYLTHRIDSEMKNKLLTDRNRLEKSTAILDPRRAREILNQKIMQFDNITYSADRNIKEKIDSNASRLQTVSALLDGINPMKVLERGYSIVTDMNGNVMTSVSKMKKGMQIRIKLKDGNAEGEIKEVKE